MQLGELYTTLRNTAYDLWVWVAFDPVTKLLPALQLGPRAQDVAYALVHALSQILAPGVPCGHARIRQWTVGQGRLALRDGGNDWHTGCGGKQRDLHSSK